MLTPLTTKLKELSMLQEIHTHKVGPVASQ